VGAVMSGPARECALIKTLLVAVLAAAASAPAWAQDGAPVLLVVDATHPGVVIDKDIQGQFAEHLGLGIYGGLWVGPRSKIPNVRGWRKDVVGALRDLHVPLLRWPGGCFADRYHWRDGVGPAAKRPVRVNAMWGGVPETNAVGTHEFFDLVDQLGARAYVNANMGSGSVQEMAEWMAYLTADAPSTLAGERRANGHAKPFPLAYFGVGNEAWGCGGHMTPEQYAANYEQYANFLEPAQQRRPKFVASGGTDDDTSWTQALSARVKGNIDAITFHYYTIPTGAWEHKGGAVGFDEAAWITTLARTERMDAMIANNAAVLDRNDPDRKIGFAVDEWGTWYDDGPKPPGGVLYQQNTLRDAVVAALNLNIFHAHADRVHMTSIAQMVDVLQAMVLTDDARMVLTPTYHVFRMYVPFQDATALPATVTGAPEYTLGATHIPALSVSAARGKDGRVHLALVNSDPHHAITIALKSTGLSVAGVHGEVLGATQLDAHNTFDAPDAVRPRPWQAAPDGHGGATLTLPPAAVVVCTVTANAAP
jgi:alpha-N-arabinofuranosidase